MILYVKYTPQYDYYLCQTYDKRGERWEEWAFDNFLNIKTKPIRIRKQSAKFRLEEDYLKIAGN